MHNTIDITKEPATDVLLPVYNCVKYGFLCNDITTGSGLLAGFIVEMAPAESGYDDPGAYIELAGEIFNMGDANTYNEVDSKPTITATQFAANLKAALEQNSKLFAKFIFSLAGGSNEVLLATARKIETIDDFTFGEFNFVTQTEPQITSNNGSPAIYRPNYRLVVEIWKCKNGVFTELITAENYIPNSSGKFELNIGKKVAPFVSSTPAQIQGDTSPFIFDENIINQIGVRYGEFYSDDLDECTTQLREFANTDCITVLNAALELDEKEKANRVFLTTMPTGSSLCDSSPMYLWVNWHYLRATLAPAPNNIASVDVSYIINYSDGTQDVYPNATTLVFPVGKTYQDGLFAVATGYDQVIESFANASKVVSSWEISLRVTDADTVVTTIGSQIFTRQSCCNPSAELYFLNELGGFDTIVFSQLSQLELTKESDIVNSFTDCEQSNHYYTGESVNNVRARRVYTVNSKFVRNYDSEQWIEQLLKSPIKYLSITTGDRTIVKKVIGLYSNSVIFNQEDNTISLELQFSDNHLLNVQNK